jgi:hypothetical protein
MRLRIIHQAIHELAIRQAGHVARWQLLRLGLTDDEIDALVERAGWITVHRGVFRLPGHPDAPRGRLWAAVLVAASSQHRGAGVEGPLPWQQVHAMARSAYGVTGFSAAWAHELTDNAPTRSQLLLPHSMRCRVPELNIIRTRLPLEALDDRQSPPTVGALRFLFDCGRILDRSGGTVGQMARLLTRADGKRLIRAEDLPFVARNPAAFGLPSAVPSVFARAASGFAKGHSHSATEASARRIVTEIGAKLGLAVEQRPLSLPDEVHPVAEADIAVPLILLDVEVDGPHHDDPVQQRYDRWRDDQLRLLGWTVRRYRAALVDEDPERFARLVEADIRQAAAAAGVRLADAR